MRKKGAIKLIPKEIWGLIRAFAIILVLAVVFVKIFFFVNPAYARSKSSLERFSDVLNILEDGESRSILLDFERGVWLFGFNEDQNFIKYRRTDSVVVRRTLEQSKPRGCNVGEACLCLCETDCKRIIGCKSFQDVEFFVVTDIGAMFNGGVSYEYNGEEGNYLAMPGQGLRQVEVWKEDDVVLLGQQRTEKDQARQEFDRLVEFANQNIGVRKPGTCKLVFEIDKTKFTSQYFIMVYTDGNAKLFSGEIEQKRNIATQTIEKAPIISSPFREDELEQIFEDYYETLRNDFIIDPFSVSYPSGVSEGIIGSERIILMQRDGDWIWARYEPGFLDECEQ
jgi:hypothetical protein